VLWEAAEAVADASAFSSTRQTTARGRAWTCAGFNPCALADTVGAGDAFLAALLMKRLQGALPDAALEAGCRLGAFVAGEIGATPAHDARVVASLSPCREEGDECVLPLELHQ